MPDGDFTRQLRLEIARWQDEGLISAAQAAAILRRYPPPPDEVPAAVAAEPASPAGVDAAADAAPTHGSAPGGQVTEEVPGGVAGALDSVASAAGSALGGQVTEEVLGAAAGSPAGVDAAADAALAAGSAPGGQVIEDIPGGSTAVPAGVDAVADAAAPGSALGGRVISVIAIMGATLVGLGIITYVAANWSAIPPLARVALLVAVTAAIYAGGWALLARFGLRRTGAAVILAGALAYGAAIHLIAQIYHLPVNHPGLTAAWFLGVAPIAYIIRARSLLTLALILLLAAAGFRAQRWSDGFGADTALLLLPAALTLAALLFAAGRLQARFDWTRPFVRLTAVPGIAMASLAVGVITLTGILTDDLTIEWASVAAEYWVTMALVWCAAAGALTFCWRYGGRWRSPLLPWEAATLATMAAVTLAMWLRLLAWSVPGSWWLLALAWFLGLAAIGWIRQSGRLLATATVLFVGALVLRAFQWVDPIDGETALLLAPAAVGLGAALFAAGRLLARFSGTDTGTGTGTGTGARMGMQTAARVIAIAGAVIASSAVYGIAQYGIWAPALLAEVRARELAGAFLAEHGTWAPGLPAPTAIWTFATVEYWTATAIGWCLVAGAIGAIWWRGGSGRRQNWWETTAAVTMAAAALVVGLWLAYPTPGLWWTLNLVWLAGVLVIASILASGYILAAATGLFALAAALRALAWLPIIPDDTLLLLAPAGITLAALLVAAGSLYALTEWSRIPAGVCRLAGILLAAAIMHIISFRAIWPSGAWPDWAAVGAEYWFATGAGWILVGAGLAIAWWRGGGRRRAGLLWETGAVATLGAVAVAAWLGLAYRIEAMWLFFGVALLAGIAVAVIAGRRAGQAYPVNLAVAVFVIALATRYPALGVGLYQGDSLHLLPPTILGIAALIFAAGRLMAHRPPARQSGAPPAPPYGVPFAASMPARLSARLPSRLSNAPTGARLADTGGLALAVFATYLMSFSGFWDGGNLWPRGASALAAAEYWLTAAIPWCAAGVAMTIAARHLPAGAGGSEPPADAARRRARARWEAGALAAMLAVAGAMWLGLAYSWPLTWLALNIALLLAVLGMVAAGYRWNRAGLINLAIAIFTIAIFTRYFEFGFGLLGQSLAFITAGAIMLALGVGLEFLRRRIMRGMRAADGMPAATDRMPDAEPEGA